MKRLLQTLQWDFKLLLRYNILTIATVITVIYAVVLYFVDTSGTEKLIAMIVFSDPVMYGYLFVSVMVLFEKDGGTLQAFAVTPRRTKEYILSRTITFGILALACSSVILAFSHPTYFNFLYFILAVILSSSLFVFIGLASIAHVKNFNQFIVIIPIVLFPTSLPFLSFWGIWDHWSLYFIPTHACLILFETSVTQVASWKIAYALPYLLAWNYFAYRVALRWYFRFILQTDRNE